MKVPRPRPKIQAADVDEGIRFAFAGVTLGLAGWIHLAIAPLHFSHSPAHGWFLGTFGLLQMAWVVMTAVAAARVFRGRLRIPEGGPWPRWVTGLRYSGLALSGGAVVLWILTQWARTPFSANPEPIDGTAVLTKLVETIAAVALLVPGPRREAGRHPLLRAAAFAVVGVLIWSGGLAAESALPALMVVEGPEGLREHTHDDETAPSFGEYLAASARLVATLARPSDYDWDLPAGFPRPRVPQDNPMTEAKVELGRYLFYDTRLSGNGQQSCASCHRQELAFTDGLPVAVGSTGEQHPRNSMALVNVAYNAALTWAHPELEILEDQIPIPMFGSHPVELGITGHEDDVLDRLRGAEVYGPLFQQAFPGDIDPVGWENIVDALASFTRALISGNSPYDRFSYGGDHDALSPSALRGMDLFLSEDFECHHCHGGFNFSVATAHQTTVFLEKLFHNTGLYDVGDGAYPQGDQGAFDVTHLPEDTGKFRPPTLRNVAVTAPYMHDGSIATLEEVLDTYAAGGRHVVEGPNAGDGRRNPYKSGFVPGFPMSEQEKQDLLAFLHALTDESFLTDPRFADPFGPEDETPAAATPASATPASATPAS
ncbi:MAG: MbnH family di-heme enzyme, partial [Acidobacteriota bacterium]